MRRLLFIPLQMLMGALAVVAANYSAPRLDLMFGPFAGSKNVLLSGDQLLSVLAAVLACHLAMCVGTLIITRTSPFVGLRRFVVEFYAAMLGTTLAGYVMFVGSLIPFCPNFYLHLYAMVGAVYVLGYVILRPVARRIDTASPSAGTWRSLVFSGPAVLTILLILSPAIMALGYKVNREFADALNYTRVVINVKIPRFWRLPDAWPDRVFEQPMSMRFAPRSPGEFYVLARPGRVYHYTISPWREELVLDFSGEVGTVESELGALGFDLHPEFGLPGSPHAAEVFVNYTHFVGGRQSIRLARFDVASPDPAVRNGSHTLLIEQNHPATGMHDGGDLFFGPDGMLYMSVGDFTMLWSQQVTERIAGGVIRIDPDCRGGEVSRPIARQPLEGRTGHYFIPRDNPWASDPEALGEFYCIGLRNPFRMSMDFKTRGIWLGDVGWDHVEEIDRLTAGSNAQWPYREGNRVTGHPRPPTTLGVDTPPVHAYNQTALSRTVVGGLIYRGAKWDGLYGKVIFADNNASVLSVLDLSLTPPWPTEMAGARQFGQQGITSIVTDAAGDIYCTVLGNRFKKSGQIVRVVHVDDEKSGAVVAAASTLSNATGRAAESVAIKFESVCARCHGSDGRGVPELTVTTGILVDKRPDFTSADWQAKTTDQMIRDAVNKGGLAAGKSRDMPMWVGFFSDAEMDELIRRLRAFGKNGQ